MEKKCIICGKKLSRNNKTGYCIKHIGEIRKGENNPFYGKKHNKETIENLKIKCSEASKKMWLNEEYRKKVINGATGLKRSDNFKEKQRKNALKQFEDEEQRIIRSIKMKDNWEKGIIPKSNNVPLNRSKQEINFIDLLKQQYNGEIKTKETLYFIDEQRK